MTTGVWASPVPIMFTDQIGVGVLAAWPFEHDIDTEADLEGVGKFDVDIDPWVVMIGVGKKF